MEPEGSLPHPQVPANCPYPEPDRSSPYPLTSHFLKIRFNIILPPTLGSPKWSLSLRFPHQNPVNASPLPQTSCMPRPSHSSRFYHPHSAGWAVQIIQLLIMQFSPPPVTPSLSDTNILVSSLFSNSLSPHSSRNVSRGTHNAETCRSIARLYRHFSGTCVCLVL